MIVSLTAYNRLDYLRDTLASIDVAAAAIYPEPTFLVARVEPSPVQAQVLDMIGSDRGTYVTLNDELLGNPLNTLAALEDAWRLANHFGEDFVLHLEDDFLLAPDALAMHTHMRDLYRYDLDVLCRKSVV